MGKEQQMKKCCGSCHQWEQLQSKPWRGLCVLDRDNPIEKSVEDEHNCLHWKPAELNEFEKRGIKLG